MILQSISLLPLFPESSQTKGNRHSSLYKELEGV